MVCYLNGDNVIKRDIRLIVAGIIMLAILVIMKTGLLAISGVIPPFPVANLENPSQFNCPMGATYASNGQPYINQSIGYCYPIMWTPGVNSSCVYYPIYGRWDGGAGPAYTACLPANYSNQTEIKNAINFNNQQIQEAINDISSELSYYNFGTNCNGKTISSFGISQLNYSNWQSYIYDCVPSTSTSGSNANLAYVDQRLISLLQQTNSYIQSHEVIIAQAPPTTPPPASTPSNFFSAISANIQALLLSIFSNFKAWFSLPTNIFSVGISGANFTTATNTTYVNRTITINIAITLNKTQLTVPWISGSSFVQETFCGSFVYYNNTKTFVYESSLMNMTTANYTNTINFKPTQTGVYVAGVSCQTTNATFSNGAWSAWSTPKVILLQQKPFAVIPQTESITPPTSTITITNTSFFNSIATAIQSFINSIINFFKSLV